MNPENPLFFGKNIFSLELQTPELLELAAWLERTATEYYLYLSEQAADQDVKNFFRQLRAMEHEHQQQIRRLYQEAASRQIEYFGLDDRVTGREFLQRVRQAALKKVWPGGFNPTVEIKEQFDLHECLQNSLDIEKNSAALYHYLGKFKLYGDAPAYIERLKNDERVHIRDIIDVMNRLPQGEIEA